MTQAQHDSRSAFVWNAGGWFGSQIGGTLWMLILGLVLLGKDLVSAASALAAFGLLNAYGWQLWCRRTELRAYVALQRFLITASVAIAAVVVLLNVRGVAEPPPPGALVSTHLPYWVVAVAPGLALMFWWRERMARRIGDGDPDSTG